MVHHRLSSPSDLRALSGSSDYGHALCEDRINFKLSVQYTPFGWRIVLYDR